MISRLALAAAAAFVLTATPALAVGKGRDVSWGRAGVSFEQYRADALECGNRAYGVEVDVPAYGPVAVWGAAVLPGMSLDQAHAGPGPDLYEHLRRWSSPSRLVAHRRPAPGDRRFLPGREGLSAFPADLGPDADAAPSRAQLARAPPVSVQPRLGRRTCSRRRRSASGGGVGRQSRPTGAERTNDLEKRGTGVAARRGLRAARA